MFFFSVYIQVQEKLLLVFYFVQFVLYCGEFEIVFAFLCCFDSTTGRHKDDILTVSPVSRITLTANTQYPNIILIIEKVGN